MFRKVENMEGGADDPRDFDEWLVGFRKTWKNILLPLIIAIGVILAIRLIAGGLS